MCQRLTTTRGTNTEIVKAPDRDEKLHCPCKQTIKARHWFSWPAAVRAAMVFSGGFDTLFDPWTLLPRQHVCEQHQQWFAEEMFKRRNKFVVWCCLMGAVPTGVQVIVTRGTGFHLVRWRGAVWFVHFPG